MLRAAKLPDGPYDRKRLLEFLEESAKNEKDWPENKPYTGEKRGKLFERKIADNSGNADEDFDDETWNIIKDSATEADLVELAALLEIPSLITQPQYHAAVIGGDISKESSVQGSGFSSVAKFEELKLFEDNPPNQTDVDDALEKIKANDPALKSINLNNIKNISEERLILFAEALDSNTNLEELLLANVQMKDGVANEFINALKNNRSLKVLNLESNFLSGKCLLNIFKAVNINQSLSELRLSNQRQRVLGYQIETAIIREIEANKSLTKLGIEFEGADARIRSNKAIMRNDEEVYKSKSK